MTKKVRLRPAKHSDSTILLVWRNNPMIREISFNTKPVKGDEHKEWFNDLLQDDNRLLFMGLLNGKRIGQVRFDVMDETAKISVNISPELIGQGLGPILITKGCMNMFRNTKIKEVIAEIKPDNEISLKAFKSVGFRIIELTQQKITMQLHIKDIKEELENG